MSTPTYERIAVCLDGSSRALDAIGPARRLARLHGARLWLVTVDDGYDDPRERLDLDLLPDDDLVGGSIVLDMQDSTAETLGRFDDQHPETLLCLTTRGRHPLARSLLGSVAGAVVRHSSQAVALVGPRCSKEDVPPISSFIVALDGSAEAEVALDWAAKWSATTTMPLALVQVIHPLPPPEAGIASSNDTSENLRYLPQVAQRMRADGHDVVSLGTQDPEPPEAIIEAAQKFDRSVIFMAPTDRLPAAQVALGSTTSTVVRGSPVPVVVVSRSD